MAQPTADHTVLLPMSGRIGEPSTTALERLGVCRLFHKPVETRALRCSIHAMLRSAAHTGAPAAKPEKWFGLSFG